MVRDGYAYLTIVILVLASSVRADENPPIPPAAQRIFDEADKAIARNRKAFEAANEEAIKLAEKGLEKVIEDFATQGKLEEALAIKNRLAALREELLVSQSGKNGGVKDEPARRKPVAKAPIRKGKPELDEQFGFADEERVNQWWQFDRDAKDHQLGSEGLRLNDGGTVRFKAGLVGDFEIGIVVKQSVWHRRSVLRVCGAAIDIGDADPAPVYRLVVVRKGNQLLTNRNGVQSVLTIRTEHADEPQYPSITGQGRLDVKAVAIKSMRVVLPDTE